MPSYSEIVREVMHRYDRHTIHSSVLPSGNRRVKCYGWRGNDELNHRLIEDIKTALANAGCNDVRTRIIARPRDDSIIIEVPTN